MTNNNFLPTELVQPILPENLAQLESVINYAEIINSETSNPTEMEPRRLHRICELGKDALLRAAVTYEILPITNEGTRYAALAATEAFTRNPLIGAAVFGGSTLLIEGAGAVAASNLITGKTQNKLFDWLNEKVKGYVPEDAKLSVPLEAGVALVAGTPVAMAVKQLVEPNRSTEQVRRRGLLMAAWVSGVCAVEGATISAGIGNYSDPKYIGGALLAVGAMASIPTWAKRSLDKHRVNQEKESMEGATLERIESVYPSRYDLTAEELNGLEQELVNDVKEQYPKDSVVGVWLGSDSKYANVIRTHEKSYFPEVSEVSDEDESHTMFLALVDTREGINRVVHGVTVTGLRYDKYDKDIQIQPDTQKETTGFYTIDSLIELGNFTKKEFVDYYAERGIDIGKSLSVETNFRIGKKTDKVNGFSSADIAYLMVFNLADKSPIKMGESAAFATINRVSQISFSRVGLEFEPLMGRKDFITEEAEHGVTSSPVALPYSEHNCAIFGAMGAAVQVPELFL